MTEISRAPLNRPIRMVAIGDSLTAGTQDATTVQERQQHCYVKQMADHAGIPFNMPYIDGEGLPFGIWHDHTVDVRHFLRHTAELGLAVSPLAAYAWLIGAPPFIVPVWDVVPDIGHRTRESRNTPEHPQSD